MNDENNKEDSDSWGSWQRLILREIEYLHEGLLANTLASKTHTKELEDRTKEKLDCLIKEVTQCRIQIVELRIKNGVYSFFISFATTLVLGVIIALTRRILS